MSTPEGEPQKIRGWLKRQCERAQKDVDEWPEWMKRTARMAGANHPDTNIVAAISSVEPATNDEWLDVGTNGRRGK